MKKGKIAFVIHQYGVEVNGGAEVHCRELAERLLPFYDVDVLTSTSMSIPFTSFFKEGIEVINGVTVRRFEIYEKSDYFETERLYHESLAGNTDAGEKWIRSMGPYCPDLIRWLVVHKGEYKVVLFMCYTWWHSYAGLSIGINNSIFIPLAHDEVNIYKPIYKQEFSKAYNFLYNTDEERNLVRRIFRIKEKTYHVKCMGMDIIEVDEQYSAKINQNYGNYIIYVGRVTQSKNYEELNRYFIEYKKTHPSDLKLLVLGRIKEGFSLIYHDDIHYLGFVSENEKRALIRNAQFLVLPSKAESLSIVLLESFAQRRPVLVNGTSPVLRTQCMRSNAGLYYMNYSEFELEMDYLLTRKEEVDEMGENGLRFVDENYRWEKVVAEVVDYIELVASH